MASQQLNFTSQTTTREAIYKRRSKREFDGRLIPKDILESIIKDAQMTPSWANSQPWRVWIATGQTLAKIKADHLARASKGERGKSDLAVMRRNEWAKFTQENMARWQEDFDKFGADWGEFGRLQAELFRAPALVYLCIPSGSSAWSVFDLGAFSQTLMLSAFDHGVDSIPAYELVKYPDIVRAYTGVPDDWVVAMGVALGYATDARVNKFISSRVALSEILTIKE